MSENQLATTHEMSAASMERVLINQDLSRLEPAERLAYYKSVCDSLQINPLTRPFAYITLNGKLTLYALKDCTEQLRKRDGVSIEIVSREIHDGVLVVVAKAKAKDGRSDESIGATNIEGLKGEARANCWMKTETKAKRRVTLSICGLGMPDDEEIDTIPGATQEPLIDKQDKQIHKGEAARLEAAGVDGSLAEPMTEEKPVIDGKVEVLPPGKSAVVITTPLNERTAEELPEDQRWRAHIVKFINLSEIKEHRVDSLTLDQLKRMKVAWVEKYADKIKDDPEGRGVEAKALLDAIACREAQLEGAPSDVEIERALNGGDDKAPVKKTRKKKSEK